MIKFDGFWPSSTYSVYADTSRMERFKIAFSIFSTFFIYLKKSADAAHQTR